MYKGWFSSFCGVGIDFLRKVWYNRRVVYSVFIEYEILKRYTKRR